MSCMPDMMPTPTSLVAAVAPRTGKYITNRINVFERGENLLPNAILQFVLRFSKLPDIALES